MSYLSFRFEQQVGSFGWDVHLLTAAQNNKAKKGHRAQNGYLLPGQRVI